MNNDSKDNIEINYRSEDELAPRMKRIEAAICDNLLLILGIVPIVIILRMLNINILKAKSIFSYRILAFFISIGVFSLLHGRLLLKNGQTIGYKLFKIKIVDLSGNSPDIKRNIITRFATFFILSQIPLLSLINLMFIFGKEKRCIHDYVAKTKVINA